MTQGYTLSLAHINDTHSNFEPSRVQFSFNLGLKALDITSHSGGYARLGYQISQARDRAAQSQMPFLFLHGGDSFQGTLYFSHFKGKANAHLLNLLSPDAMVIGNHDIDEGNARLAEFAKQIDFPLLAGNMDLSQEDIRKPGNLRTVANILAYDEKNQLASYLEKPFYDKKLAIIGITLDQMKNIARPDPDTHFVDAIATTARTVAHLHAKGIKHIIVLSHLGLDQDKRLAEQVDGISLIVGGHTHTLQGDFSALGLSNIPYGETIHGTPIVHAGKYAETLGLAEIEFDAAGRAISLKGGNYFMLDKQFMLSSSEQVDDTDYRAVQQRFNEHPYVLWDDADEDIHGVIQDIYRPAIAEMENKVLALVPKNLVHTRLPSKALPHGSEIAPWVSRSMFQEAKLEDPRIHFALHNAGGVRQSVAQGRLTLADVLGQLLPFELPLVKYEIQGQYLYQALESAINAATNNSVRGTGAGSFPYTYGLRYYYDGRRPLGERLFKLEMMQQDGLSLWYPVQPNALYVGVSTSYTAAGKEGYHPLLQARWQESIETLTLPQAFIRFLNRAPNPNLADLLSPHVHYTSHVKRSV
ncbi:bifunctional metallophosphatase/5'-nucleotidase [Shewanella bicestrii]|uniref:Bifunctional metallophosphatase/5'-nucleotidase n=1 Tax=Shewanella bicestrii TaxID=2018305 RepID=A0A220UPD4_9GAMM|nr:MULTISPECIES: bifunctional metallophosphatase/5'-nucleotidase [Shewanella]ABK47459.1 metallophosphoesterase [Shewanella sp. ANA-3]ASK69975.1 bifunctional metallophosphatase/5'-nucleotidase [Shewanella bicestrii]